MSTTIDQRVVEMRFDNQQFERNVSHTMSTLDKLKNLLNFKGASKGLESVNSAAKNVNMNALGHSVEAVSMKFSALQVMGVTALANITNSAVNAGKRIVSALTIDPIRTGFQEYETQINAVQTILANTSHAGTTINDVNKALEELNKYADQTIYNFTEMTRNIGTFTAAGVDLETSTSAIKGIANLAAVSGSTSQQASTAMYQLSQALAAGKVSLMDWNSVVNAGMGGKVFQDALTRTADVMNKGAASAAIKKYGSFRESLTQGEWLTTDVLTETLNQFTMAAEEGTEQWEEYKKSLKEKGYTEEQAVEILKMANTATDAATKVKTFTQLWDVLKESAQSGWSQTWKLIVGDFDQAKNLLSPLAETLTGFINRMSDFRNRILEIGLHFSKPWTAISDKLGNIKKVAENVGKVTDKLEYFQEVVNKVWRGDYKNSDTGRFDLLEKAGYDHRVVQDLVNKGHDYKLTIEDIEASHKKFGLTMENTSNETKKASKAFEKLSDQKLKDAGLTKDEIALYRAMEKEADRLGISVGDLADKMSKTDGRTLLVDSFKNIGDVFVGIGKVAKEAWIDIFNPPGAEVLGIRLYGLLDSLKQFTETLRLTDKETGKLTENGEKIKRTFKGVFALIDIITTVLGGGFKLAVKIVTELLDRFDLNLLDITANVGDVLVKFRDWVESILNISGAVDVLVPLVKKAAKFISDLIEAVKNSKWFADFCEYVSGAAEGIKNLFSSISGMSEFQKLVDVLRKAGEAVSNWIATLKESDNIPGDIIAGLVKGITNGVPDVIAAVFDLAKAIITGICEVLGIHSPATTMIAIGGFIIAGLVQGIAEGEITLIATAESLAENVWLTMKTAFTYLGERVVNLLKSVWKFIADENGNIQWGKIVAGGMMGALLWVLIQFANAFKGLTDGIGGIGDLLEESVTTMKKLGGVLTGYSWDLKAKALQKLAIAVAILVGSIVVLAQVDDIGKLWNAVGILVVLSGILVGLAFAMDKFTKTSVDFDNKKIEGLRSGLLQIALCIGVLAYVVKMIGDMEREDAIEGFIGLGVIAGGLLIFMAALGGISKYSKDVRQFGSVMMKLAIAMMLMVTVVKLVAGLTAEEIVNGIIFATAFAIFVNSITKVAKSAGNNVGRVGGMILKLTIAMALMVGVVKLASMLSPKEMFKGAIFAAGFTAFVWALVKCTKIGSKQKLASLGGLVMSISVSMALMVGVCKLVGMLSIGDILKGAAFAAGFIGMVKIMVNILSIGSEQKLAKVGATILAMSVAIGIMAAVSVALGYVSLEGLVKGVSAVSLLCLMMTTMIRGLKGANDVKGSIMMMAIAIGVMVASIIALTFIDDTGKLAGAVASISIVMGMFALIARSTRQMTKAVGAIAIMSVAVGMLAGILYLLTNNIEDADAAVKVAASLSILLLALAGVAAIMSVVGKAGSATFVGLGVFAAIIAGMGLIMVALADLNRLFPKLQEWLDTGIVILQKIGEGIGALIGGVYGGFIGGLGEGMMNGLSAAADTLNEMLDTLSEVTDKLANISSEGVGIKSDGLDRIASLLGVLGTIASTAVGTSFADLFTGWLSDQSAMEKFETDAVAFFDAMRTIGEASTGITLDQAAIDSILSVGQKFAELQASLEPIGGFMDWLVGRDDLGTFGINVSSFMSSMKIGLGSLDGFTFDAAALDTVITAAKNLLDLQSSLEPIDGFIDWLSGRDDLSTFGTDISEFITSMKVGLGTLDGFAFDAVALEAIISATKELSVLQTSLEPIDGVIQFFTGRDDLSTFGIDISKFISSMKTGLGSLEGFTFNSESLKLIITAAKELSTLQASLEPIDGVIQFFTGRDDLSTFGTDVAAFITSMKTALAALEGATLDEIALQSVVKAAGDLAAFQSKLEPMGNVITWFTGRTDLGTFGINVGLFAEAMRKLKGATGENGISEDAVLSITNAGNAIIELQKALPTEGWFDGKMDLSEFSEYITEFGTAMGTFSETAAGIDTVSIGSIITNAYRIKDLITSLVGLDTSGLQAFTGVGTGGVGADGAAKKIAQAIAEFSDEVDGVNTAAISTSVSAASTLKTLINGLVNLDTSGIEKFDVTPIGTAMKNYSDKVADIDSTLVADSISSANRLKTFIASLTSLDSSGINNFKASQIANVLQLYSASISNFNPSAVAASISAANRIKKFIAELSHLDSSGVGSFKSAVEELSGVKIAEMIEAFSGASDKLFTAGAEMLDGLARGLESKTDVAITSIKNVLTAMSKGIITKIPEFRKAGEALVVNMTRGFSNKKNATKTAVVACVSAAVSAIRSKYSSFDSAGSYLGSGLVVGINSKQQAVYRAGYALGQMAVQGEKDGQKSKSPSKLTIQSGKWFGEGLVIGIRKMGDKVYTAGHELGDTAVKSLSSTVSRIAAAIDSDVDVQPTIRPVLDLSDIRSGAGAISGMLGVGSSVGVLANVNGIGSMMNRRGQNVSNADVVSAIEKLDKHLDNVGNTTYSIAGITYDDGSNIATAVKDLTRYARMERRV